MSDIVQRPDYTGKKIHHAEEFELCYLRHRYLRRSTRNPSAEEMAPYLKIIKRIAYSQHNVYHHIFNAVSMGEDDLVSIGQVHLVSYLNLYAIQVKPKKFERFVITFAKKNMREPSDDEVLNKNKADFTSFLNQRMIDIVRLCTLKSSSITGKQMVEYFPYFGPNPPKRLDASLIGKYEKIGYKRIDRIGYRAAKNKANIKEDKPFWYNGNWYFVIYNEKTPLTQDDLTVSDANPFDNAHQLNPEQYMAQDAETKRWHRKLLQFEGDSVDNRVRLITNFITSKKLDPKYAEEIKTARKILKELVK